MLTWQCSEKVLFFWSLLLKTTNMVHPSQTQKERFTKYEVANLRLWDETRSMDEL